MHAIDSMYYAVYRGVLLSRNYYSKENCYMSWRESAIEGIINKLYPMAELSRICERFSLEEPLLKSTVLGVSCSYPHNVSIVSVE